MKALKAVPLSARALRAEVGARNAQRAVSPECELGYGRQQSVLFQEDAAGRHGNFLQPSYKRICAREDWAERLRKTYTGSARLPRAHDRRRGELECATSSDALLMNVFCYPGVTGRQALCAALGVERGLRPEFGVRAQLTMHRGEIDRTELDMRLGSLLVEAKLTEGGFGRASRERLLRYESVENIFDLDELPRSAHMFLGYQLIRGVLAAVQGASEYLVLLDDRRADLIEQCFGVSRAIRSADVRQRLRVLTWQEVSGTLPPAVQRFLAEKYGIFRAR